MDIEKLAQEIAEATAPDLAERDARAVIVQANTNIITRHLAPLKERDERVRLRAIRDCMDVVSGADFSTATGYAHARRTLLTGLRRLEARSNIALRELGEGGRR